MNEFTIVAGAFGVGKSSFIGALAPLKNSLGKIISDNDMTAMRRIQSCMDDGVDFTLESTLSGENTLTVLFQTMGHDVSLFTFPSHHVK